MRALVIWLFLFAMPALAGTADAQLTASLLAESRLTIEGRSTVSGFECRASEVTGAGIFEDGRVDARVVVPVSSFDCGMSRMNRDFHEAMEADEHPEIVFELDHARAEGSFTDAGLLTVTGRLTIAGVTREMEFEVRAEQVYEALYRVRGEKPLLMTDFGIDPPSALAGLVRARDRIVVHFDLLAATSSRLGPTLGASSHASGNTP